MEAQVHITGYAGTEVEVRGNGTVSAFRLACTPRIRTKSGWSDGNTTWIEVACFRTLAQHVAQSVRKGDPVVVVGKLRTNVLPQPKPLVSAIMTVPKSAESPQQQRLP